MAAKILLPLLSLFALYAVLYYAEIKGTNKLIRECIEARKLPGDNATLRTVYTGIAPLDELLTVLTIFFWPATDGSNPSLSVHSIGFAGAFSSAWVLVSLEAWRRGNAWTVTAFPMVFGLAAQVMTIAVVGPLYCAIQLYTSVTAVKPTAENIRVPRAVLNALPLVFAIGSVVPNGLLMAPISEQVSADLKQIFIASWQPWPGYISILLTTIHALFSRFVSNDTTVEGGRATLQSLRLVYAFAFVNTALCHIVSWVIPLATVVAPVIFKEEYLGPLHPLVVFGIPNPWGTAPSVESVADGVQAFLRWDYLISSAGVLIWAISLYQTANRVIYGRVGCIGLFTKVAALTALVGPVGAAVELLWERDELVINELGGLKAATSKEKKLA